jgi:hypothetical protein
MFNRFYEILDRRVFPVLIIGTVLMFIFQAIRGALN